MFLFLIFLVLFFIVCGIVGTSKEKKENAERAKVEKKQNEALAIEAGKAFLKFGEYFTGATIIDSGVWMDPDCRPFFFLLEKYCLIRSSPLLLPELQFEQFSKLKASAQTGHKNYELLSLAFERMDNLDKSGALRIVPAPFQNTSVSYTDAFVLPWMDKMSLPGKTNTFFFSDKELCIRIRRGCSTATLANWNIVDIASVSLMCTNFAQAWAGNLINEGALSALSRENAPPA